MPSDGVEVAPLRALEIASGVVTGMASKATLVAIGDGVDAADALEQAVLPALTRAPCLVSFSGGIDSSLVLAVADRAARRHGLPRPTPVTFRFRDAPMAEENDAQEAVIAALGSPDWQRIPIDDELHLLGPVATDVLRRHGLVHPANAFLLLPLLRLAAGGALLTGFGGDQILGGWRRAPRKRKPWWWPGRGPIGGRRAPAVEWLRPLAAQAVRHAIARERASQPHRFDERIAWHAARRDLALGLDGLHRLAAGEESLLVCPLVDPAFCAALAERGGSGGFAPSGVSQRPLLVRTLFPDLPGPVAAPRRKATFAEVFWRAPTTDLLRGWDGSGVDTRVVDAARLRLAWAASPPRIGTSLLAQSVWLASRCHSGTS